jgi:hypothetical protein
MADSPRQQSKVPDIAIGCAHSRDPLAHPGYASRGRPLRIRGYTSGAFRRFTEVWRNTRQNVRPNAKTRRAFLRTGFERSNSLWTKHPVSLDQSTEFRIVCPHVEKIGPDRFGSAIVESIGRPLGGDRFMAAIERRTGR